MLASCQTDDPLEEPITGRVIASNQDTQEAQGRVIQFANAQNVGAVTIGKEDKIIQSFMIENMRDALVSLKLRKPINPFDGRINQILDELDLSPYAIRCTHRYVKITLRNEAEARLIENDTTLFYSPLPFDRQIQGTGTLPHESADFEPETGKTRIIGSYTPQYTIIPITQTLFPDLKYEVLAELYIPHLIDKQLADAANTPMISQTFADILTDQALYVSGAKTIDELLNEKVWTPSGCIQVDDPKLNGPTGVPNIRVYAYNNAQSAWAETDKNGNFRLDRTFKGPVNYRIEWATNDYRIMNSAGEAAYYYCGSTINGALYLNVQGGEPKSIATIARALSRHYYGENSWGRVNEFWTPASPNERFRIYYKHSYDPTMGGVFHPEEYDSYINIWGKYNDGTARGPASLINTTFHELGHAAMYFEKKMGYGEMQKIMKESWASFIGWFITKVEYKALGHDVYPK